MKGCPQGWHWNQGGHAPAWLIFLFTNEVPWQEERFSPLNKVQSDCAESSQAVSNCCTGTDSLLTPFGAVAPKHTDQSVSWLFSNVC